MDQGFGQALRGEAGESGVPTPVQAMTIEHVKLLTTFRDSEGRDPNPKDSDYWSAYKDILTSRAGLRGSRPAKPPDNFKPFGPGVDS